MEINSVEPNGDTPTSTNITSSEIDSETASKLRGDAIGETMYSEVFVLKTLMQFSDLQWSKEVEDDLCFLWDMTEEKDVCAYLFQVSFPSLACNAIIKYDDPRFIEIVVGIFANLLCSKCQKSVSLENVAIVLNLLNSEDPLVLVQVMRFIHAISYMYEQFSFISEDVMEKFVFILNNSTHRDLLFHSLKTVASIVLDSKLDASLVRGELVQASTVAYQILKKENDAETEFRDQHLINNHYIQIVCNICGFVDRHQATRLVTELEPHIGKFCEEIGGLLDYFTIKDNLLLVPEEINFYIEAITYISMTLSFGYKPEIVQPLIKILLILDREKPDDLKNFAELFCYFVTVTSVPTLREECANFKGVLKEISRCNFIFDFEYKQSLDDLIKEL